MRPVEMVEVWRGPFLESVHTGQAVICDAAGEVVRAWGDPDAVVLSRSASKMIQALPLLRSGAAKAARLGTEHLALACASHIGAGIHTGRVTEWLAQLALTDDALLCGPQVPDDTEASETLIRSGTRSCQVHNNCSGKHAGFLTLAQHLRAGPEYVAPDHPVQVAVRVAYEETTAETTPGFGIDGCSAPNFASTLKGLARAMAHFAAAPEGSAEARLHAAMRLHPELVAGEGRACTELMRAMDGRVVVKTGAEGVYTAILPEQKLGVALKITDGTTRASECAIAAILVKIGVLSVLHPATQAIMDAAIFSRSGREAGRIRPSEILR